MAESESDSTKTPLDISTDALKTKLVQLNRGQGKSDSVLKAGKERAIRRHVDNLKEILKEVCKWQRIVEGHKISSQMSAEDINEWSERIERKIEEGDDSIADLESGLEEIERQKTETTTSSTKPTMDTEYLSVQAKLPKLTITKFNGTYADWPRFWGQFSETIHRLSMRPITKFTYLREHLNDQARKTIEALPYTPEGYNRAVAMLKDRFGKESEIVKAYVKEILDLPHTATSNPKRILEFYEKLAYSVQSLETMKQLHTVNGTVSMTLEKLPNIRGDLVRNDPDWESWDYIKLTEAIRLWTRRNPAESKKHDDTSKKERPTKESYHFQTHQNKSKQRKGCVYCDSESHRSSDCDRVTTFAERKKILATKRLCFNCTGASHRASECKSTSTCKHCSKRHHTSICNEFQSEIVNTAHMPDDKEVIYPIVLVEIDGIKTHALLDTGAGSSYASSKLISALKKEPKQVKTKRIEMMLGSSTTRIEVYSAQLKSLDGEFNMTIELSKVDKPELMTLKNPNYKEMLQKYHYLKGAKLEDPDDRPNIPVHVVLGASEYAKVKMTTSPKVGQPGQPVAERTKLGWTVISSGREESDSPVLLTQAASTDYEQLCSLDVLGLADRHENDQLTVYDEFKEQLSRDETGWYEAKLPWIGNHQPLLSNEAGSKQRLKHLVKKLEKTGRYSEYDSIIQQQLSEGIIEKAPVVASNQEFYIPHKAVVRDNAESTKLRIVYDASASESNSQPSLNDCLHPGPSLQNLLWDVLVRSRFYPILLTGDLMKAFLQIRIAEEDRDALRFHWMHPNSSHVEVYRFTRALFGLTSSPFLLGGVVNHHLDSWKDCYPEIVEQLRNGLYVDDLMIGGTTVEETESKKEAAKEIFEDATFTIHKWHSNARELEPPNDEVQNEAEEVTYAKTQLGGQKNRDGKLLGLPWNREQDVLSVTFKSNETVSTKRNLLSQLAKIYDPLGLVSPTVLTGKLVYRDVCDSKISWDGDLREDLTKRYKIWNNMLADFSIPRTLTPYREAMLEVTLHGFGGASSQGVCAVVYAVTKQESGVTQGLVCAKSRLAKRGLTIPRLELISGHMVAKLASNVCQAIVMENVKIHCWLDSTVALYWIQDRGEYRQFVTNRVQKIREYEEISWHHVPTTDNPADVGSRGGNVVGNQLWREGPLWLAIPSEWPPDITLQASTESQSETKVKKEMLKTAVAYSDVFDQLLEKHPLHKVLRIGALVQRFIRACKRQSRTVGPIKTQEVKQQKLWWIRRAQKAVREEAKFHEDQQQLNLQLNDDQVLECRGRIVGEYPIYLPDAHPFTALVVHQAHLVTLHGGVSTTMAKIREQIWVPRLRRLVKKITKKCNGCRRFRAKAYEAPPPGRLPTTRTKGSRPFQIIGVDFAGPIKYLQKLKKEGKAYLVLYACSLTRAVYLELVTSLDTKEFIMSLKRFIARRGRPEIIYSDNATTFKAANKWIKLVRKDEEFHALLSEFSIEWRYNLSRAPWWGGQYERLVGVFKSTFYKTVGNGTLYWKELEEVVLDVEIAVNNRPLGYVEDDIELPTLTPNSFLQLQSNYLPELPAQHVTEGDLRKRAKLLLKSKQEMWNRWTREYIRCLREQHRLTRAKEIRYPQIGEVVIIKEEQKPRNIWKLGVVHQLFGERRCDTSS